MKRTLNDKLIAGLKPAPAGKRYDAWDAVVPGFGVRTTDKGAKSFILSATLPGQSKTSRLTIGVVGKIGLATAREIARQWLGQIAEGHDPRVLEKDREEAQQKKATDDINNCFRTVAQTYLKTKLGSLKPKTRAEVTRNINVHFIAPWGDRPVHSITTRDLADVIVKLAAVKPGAARVALSHVKQLFNWMIVAGYIAFSPSAAIVANRLLGKPNRGDRVLDDGELARVWNAALGMPYPVGPIYLMLILSGCRLNEVARMSRSEIDMRQRRWVIPASRMKGRKPHVIPLTDTMLAVLQSLPRHNAGDYVFSKDDGVSPIVMGEWEKDLIDKAAEFTDWVNHDLRRTMRTGLSEKAMGIAHHVAEMMVAHVQPGVVGTYDLFDYVEEKRAGFEAWNAKVERITGGLPKRLRLVA